MSQTPYTDRKLHAAEPVSLTNVHAHYATRITADIDSANDRGRETTLQEALAEAQVQASLAVAQEVKNLRVYLEERDVDRAVEAYHRGD